MTIPRTYYATAFITTVKSFIVQVLSVSTLMLKTQQNPKASDLSFPGTGESKKGATLPGCQILKDTFAYSPFRRRYCHGDTENSSRIQWLHDF
jgi:hypothetical protein